MQIGYAPKSRYRITYWKSIESEPGVTLHVIPKQVYEYKSDTGPNKDKLLDFLKENDISYEIIEIQERLIEKSE